MAHQSDPVPAERALIPAAPRALTSLRRALPVSRQVALGIAASAVGTIFVKRLVELVAQDVYHRILRRRPSSGNPQRRRRLRASEARVVESAPQAEPIALVPSGGAFFVRVVRVWRISAGEQESDA